MIDVTHSVQTLPKQSMRCPWLFYELDMRIKCVFGHTKRVVGGLSPLSLKSYEGLNLHKHHFDPFSTRLGSAMVPVYVFVFATSQAWLVAKICIWRQFCKAIFNLQLECAAYADRRLGSKLSWLFVFLQYRFKPWSSPTKELQSE